MRVWLGIALLLLMAGCRNGNKAGGNTTTASNIRTLEITDSIFRNGGSDTLRYGRMHSGEIAVKSVDILNSTSHPLAIISYDRSCGCTGMTFERKPIAVGESQRVELKLDTRGEWGWQFRHIDVWMGGSQKPLRIFFEAQVE